MQCGQFWRLAVLFFPALQVHSCSSSPLHLTFIHAINSYLFSFLSPLLRFRPELKTGSAKSCLSNQPSMSTNQPTRAWMRGLGQASGQIPTLCMHSLCLVLNTMKKVQVISRSTQHLIASNICENSVVVLWCEYFAEYPLRDWWLAGARYNKNACGIFVVFFASWFDRTWSHANCAWQPKRPAEITLMVPQLTSLRVNKQQERKNMERNMNLLR